MKQTEELLELVAQGKVSPGEASDLLASIQRPKSRVITWIFSPFELLSTKAALTLGALAAATQLLLSLLHVRFNGVLDAHVGRAPVPWVLAAADLLISWGLGALVFWGASRLVARQGRLVDFIGAVGIARMPIVFIGVVIGVLREVFMPAQTPGVLTIIFGLSLLPLVAWTFVLFVTGFRVASGLRGWKLGVTVAATIFIAEAVTWSLTALAFSASQRGGA